MHDGEKNRNFLYAFFFFFSFVIYLWGSGGWCCCINRTKCGEIGRIKLLITIRCAVADDAGSSRWTCAFAIEHTREIEKKKKKTTMKLIHMWLQMVRGCAVWSMWFLTQINLRWLQLIFIGRTSCWCGRRATFQFWWDYRLRGNIVLDLAIRILLLTGHSSVIHIVCLLFGCTYHHEYWRKENKSFLAGEIKK